MKVRIATRGSDLALWQANHVASRLQAAGAETELLVLKTRGDRIDDVPLTGLEGKGFFTVEIERALLDGDADLAVHSHKDLPFEGPPELEVVAGHLAALDGAPLEGTGPEAAAAYRALGRTMVRLGQAAGNFDAATAARLARLFA